MAKFNLVLKELDTILDIFDQDMSDTGDDLSCINGQSKEDANIFLSDTLPSLFQEQENLKTKIDNLKEKTDILADQLNKENDRYLRLKKECHRQNNLLQAIFSIVTKFLRSENLYDEFLPENENLVDHFLLISIKLLRSSERKLQISSKFFDQSKVHKEVVVQILKTIQTLCKNSNCLTILTNHADFDQFPALVVKMLKNGDFDKGIQKLFLNILVDLSIKVPKCIQQFDIINNLMAFFDQGLIEDNLNLFLTVVTNLINTNLPRSIFPIIYSKISKVDMDESELFLEFQKRSLKFKQNHDLQ